MKNVPLRGEAFHGGGGDDDVDVTSQLEQETLHFLQDCSFFFLMN